VDRKAVDAARTLLKRAVDTRIFPAATAEVGDSCDVHWRVAAGALTFEASAPPADHSAIFDLASLTKPIVTTSVILRLAEGGALDIREPVAACLREWRGEDRERATVQDLLEHAGGLAARLIDRPPRSRREFEHEICTMRLEYSPGDSSVYSDLGFILLGFIAEDRGRASLARQFAAIVDALPGLSASDTESTSERVLTFEVADTQLARTAPTQPLEDDPRRGRLLVGEVHDSYASALGGAAGHAGLFGTAAGVGAFARAVLQGARGEVSALPFSPSLVAAATAKSRVPGSSRALGWDTMLPTSSCGTRMSPAAFGHVGYTGTSLWIDPVRDRYFVLLTNRACGGGTVEQIREVRRAFHDLVAAEP
jgi:CubicO group peptidase (beta-lactamase class C family)